MRRVLNFSTAILAIAMGGAMVSEADAQTTITLKSDATTQAASTPADPALLDSTTGAAGLSFQPVDVEPGGTRDSLPIPSGAPPGTVVVNIPPRNFDDGLSGYFKLTFDLPSGFSGVTLSGAATIDNAGRVFLNGNPITSSIFSSNFEAVNRYGFQTSNAAFFKAGTNEILISNYNLEPYSPPNPSGAAFYVIVSYRTQPAVASIKITPAPAVLFSGQQQTFTATGYDRNGGSLGPVTVDWSIDGSQSSEVPDIALTTATTGSSITIKAGATGGLLKPGIRATASGGAAATALVVVPFIRSVFLQDPFASTPTIIQTTKPTILLGPVTPPESHIQVVAADKVAIFPDKAAPGASPRNVETVTVTAEMGPPEAAAFVGVLFFRSYDADDEDDPPVDRSDAEGAKDNNPDLLLPPGSLPPEGSLSATRAPVVVQPDGRLLASVNLTTSLSPGDNYRVVAAVEAAALDGIAAIQSDGRLGRLKFVAPVDPMKPLVPSDASAPVSRPEARTSPLMTVWRSVHIELDSMKSVEEQEQKKAKAILDGVVDASAPLTGGATVSITVHSARIPNPGSALFLSLLQGFLVVRDKATGTDHQFQILDLRRNSLQQADVAIRIPPGSTPPSKGDKCSLRDDDDQQLFSPPRDVQTVITFLQESTDPARNVFAPVFLVPRFDGGGDERNNDVVDFQVNFGNAQIGDPARAVQLAELIAKHWQSRANSRDPGYFSAYVLIGYQPAANGDADPYEDDAWILGETPKQRGPRGFSIGFAIVYTETMRDAAVNGRDTQPNHIDAPFPGTFTEERLREQQSRMLAHELGHAIGTIPDPADPATANGIMGVKWLLSPSEMVFQPDERRLLRVFDPRLRESIEDYIANGGR